MHLVVHVDNMNGLMHDSTSVSPTQVPWNHFHNSCIWSLNYNRHNESFLTQIPLWTVCLLHNNTSTDLPLPQAPYLLLKISDFILYGPFYDIATSPCTTSLFPTTPSLSHSSTPSLGPFILSLGLSSTPSLASSSTPSLASSSTPSLASSSTPSLALHPHHHWPLHPHLHWPLHPHHHWPIHLHLHWPLHPHLHWHLHPHHH